MSAHYEAATSRPLIKEPVDVHWMLKDHNSGSGWKIKAAKKKPYNIFGVLLWEQKLLPGTVNDPCLRNKSLYACCVLARPFNIHSHRGYIPLSGRNMPRLSSHSPLPPLQQNAALFFFAVFWSACMPWRSRLGGERERDAYLFVAVSSPVRIKRATRSQSENIISL